MGPTQGKSVEAPQGKGNFLFLCKCMMCWLVLAITGPSWAHADTGLADADSAVAATDENTTNAEAANELHFGGALRFNYFVRSWEGQEANRDKGGDFNFEVLLLKTDGTLGDLDLSLDYRFYAGYSMLRYGYLGYTFDGGAELQVGVSRKPLGLLPYASHSWFFNIAYYLGMEDDSDAGVKLVLPADKWNFQFAFYKNSEGSYTGNSINSARYSYDVVHTDETELGYAGLTEPRTNEEINQVNGRVAYTIPHGGVGSSEVGLSGEYGGLYNSTLRRTGNHWAVAGHWNGTYGSFNLMLQAIGFEFNPQTSPGQDDRFVVLGAYDAPYKVTSKGSIFLANIAYRIALDASVIDVLTIYNNYSHLAKSHSQFNDSQQNVLGVSMAVGPVYAFLDFAAGKNHPWIGPNYGSSLAEGDPDAQWELRFNINMGYYF